MPVSMMPILIPAPVLPRSCQTDGAPMNGTLWTLSCVTMRTSVTLVTPGSALSSASLPRAIRTLKPE